MYDKKEATYSYLLASEGTSAPPGCMAEASYCMKALHGASLMASPDVVS
jgi:hypothetical protein